MARFVQLILLSSLLAPVAAVAEVTLVVLLAVDQLRADRLTADLPGGLGRLVREGYVFSNATLDHGLTNTCPGHVVMSTGMNPSAAGIPGNSYVDHTTMADRYCVDDDDPGFTEIGGDIIRSPRAIATTTLGDWLQAAMPGSRVYSVSGKDRAAIALGGHGADGAFWYSRNQGRFTSSGYYGELPGYVETFNGEDLFVDGRGAAVPPTWEHTPGTLRDDDFAGEAQELLRVSGHPLNQGDAEARATQLYVSPWLDVLTGQLAREVLAIEELGQRPGVVDLLAVSYSATDIVGHRYGPFSAESSDALARLDEEVGVLLADLDARGIDYVVALSADHGVLPLPEYLASKDELNCPVESGRISLTSELGSMMVSAWWNFTFPFGNPRDLFGFSSAGFVINAQMAEEYGHTVPEIRDWLEGWLEERDWVAEAWTEEEIRDGETEYARLYQNSWVPGKSGHLVVQTHETCIGGETGTTHGSPYRYDRHIPLVFFGNGIRTAQSDESAHSIDIAPTIARRLGIDVPATLDGTAREVFK